MEYISWRPVYNPSKAFLSFIDVGWDLQFGELCFSVLRESGPVGLLEVHERFVLAYLGFNVSGAAYNNWEVVGPEGDLGLPAGVGKEGEGGELRDMSGEVGWPFGGSLVGSSLLSTP